MSRRIIIRFSLNSDTRSIVRNYVGKKILAPSGIVNTGTGTWEISRNVLPMGSIRAAVDAVKLLSNPSTVAGAAQSVRLDHLWLYID